ncbi:MAG: hypothetical protein ACREKS_23405 [Candidatus Rokuibacteriota bacterium]
MTGRRRGLAVAAWLVSGVAGALVFWLVQVMAGEGTIPQFMGEQIARMGGYAPVLAPAIGWAVHLGVSLAYAGCFALIASSLARTTFPTRVAVTLVLALGLGWVTAVIAPPAISVTISVLGRRGWPAELFPFNTEIGLPFWNHLLFFALCWLVQVVIAERRLFTARI